MNKDKLDKIIINLDENDWHGYATETLWGEHISNNKYVVRNVPYYAKGISAEDIIEVEQSEGILYFKKIIERNGHSTYRIYIKDKNNSEFDLFWNPLEKIGCTYEKATDKFYAIDVPPQTDIYRAYELLENGEKSGFWEFEEGHCGHPIKS